jgi:excisionase family DNA binding protein
MSQRLYSIYEVAELLGLHVKTVRLYVRDGKLKATRIGKQYRIAQEDLEALTGKPAPKLLRDSVRRERFIDVSTIVRIDAVSPELAARITATLSGAVNARDGGKPVDATYDEARGQLTVIVAADVAATTGVLGLIAQIAGEK